MHFTLISSILFQNGYLSALDDKSTHGSCDVQKGTKWVANVWVSIPTYKDRFKPSVFYREHMRP